MQYIGIDLAKSTFVAAFPQEKGYVTATYNNDLKGIETFLAQLNKTSHHCVLIESVNSQFRKVTKNKRVFPKFWFSFSDAT